MASLPHTRMHTRIEQALSRKRTRDTHETSLKRSARIGDEVLDEEASDDDMPALIRRYDSDSDSESDGEYDNTYMGTPRVVRYVYMRRRKGVQTKVHTTTYVHPKCGTCKSLGPQTNDHILMRGGPLLVRKPSPSPENTECSPDKSSHAFTHKLDNLLAIDMTAHAHLSLKNMETMENKAK